MNECVAPESTRAISADVSSVSIVWSRIGMVIEFPPPHIQVGSDAGTVFVRIDISSFTGMYTVVS